MKKIDLHIHSYYSDGEASPKEIINIAQRENIKLLSLTDHNFIFKDEEIKKYALEKGMVFVEGLEISSLDRKINSSLHILGYSNNFDAGINDDLRETVDGYNSRAKGIINKLNKEFPGINLDFDFLKSKNKEIYVSRNTLIMELLKFLKDKMSFKEAKKRAFVEENDDWMLRPERAVEIIKNRGGVAVLAHSGNLLEKLGTEKYEKLVKNLCANGLGGLEVYHPKHTKENIENIKHLAKKLNILITGGSDWHGFNFSPKVKPGCYLGEENYACFLESLNS